MCAVSDHELPDAESGTVLQFPRPRLPEQVSPYRKRVASRVDPPPVERARRVVRRPEPPDRQPPSQQTMTARRRVPEAPMPAGFFDEVQRVLSPLTTFVGNNPHLVLLILVGVACLTLGACGRAKLGGSFAG